MDAWGKSVGAGDKVIMLADGNGQFAKALGVELDLTDKGLGVRSRRYALLADDQVGRQKGRGRCCAIMVHWQQRHRVKKCRRRVWCCGEYCQGGL